MARCGLRGVQKDLCAQSSFRFEVSLGARGVWPILLMERLDLAMRRTTSRDETHDRPRPPLGRLRRVAGAQASRTGFWGNRNDLVR